ncbi:Trp biosynthesis-associated membrane protein [uncultured Friedmanniella sp.]|uniref:Trp biosynthesis-associated membrane protein n=1 Tax=uncultured Friedmanniella sp. TaxID=335381 RepID=UPI0035C9585D
MAGGARLRTRALVAGLAGAALALLAGAQSWWRVRSTGVSVSFSGTATTAGLSQALGVVALAGWLLVLVLRRRGRQLVGVLSAVTGAAVAVLGAVRPRPNAATVQAGIREVSLADQFALTASLWPYVYAAAGLLVLAAGVLVTTTAARWPQRADRFSRAAATARVTAADDPAAVWRAQDAGLDPTAEARTDRRDLSSTESPPDVLSDGIRDTMGDGPQTRPPE